MDPEWDGRTRMDPDGPGRTRKFVRYIFSPDGEISSLHFLVALIVTHISSAQSGGGRTDSISVRTSLPVRSFSMESLARALWARPDPRCSLRTSRFFSRMASCARSNSLSATASLQAREGTPVKLRDRISLSSRLLLHEMPVAGYLITFTRYLGVIFRLKMCFLCVNNDALITIKLIVS